MNCLEFRRLLGSVPECGEATFVEHRETCARCADAFERAQAFEQTLARAFAVPVPSHLADRVLFAQLTAARRERSSSGRRFGWVAFAAAAVLVLAVGVTQVARADALSTLCAGHIPYEPGAFASRDEVQSALIENDFVAHGSPLRGAVPAGVTYLNDCPIGRYRSVHMVMTLNDQPVTVFFIAGHREDARKDFHSGVFQGRQVPLGSGTLVMLSQDARNFDTIEHGWSRAILGDAAAIALAP